MVRAAENLEGHFRNYEAQSDRFRQSSEATAGAQARELVAYANFIYDRIKRIDEEWTAQLGGSGGAPPDADADAVWELYAKWCGKAEADLRRANELDAKGITIQGIDRLRQAYYEARDLLSVVPEQVRRAARSAQEGHTRPLGEIRDELRRELHS